MHVGAKKMAIAGLLAAFSAVLLVLSSVIESNSLFLIAAASFCVGIVIREWGVRYGIAFGIASTILNLILVANKFYCLTYAAMGGYLIFREALWCWIADQKEMKQRTLKLWIGKYTAFNAVYIPIVLLFQELLFGKEMTWGLLLGVIAAGQIVLLVYDQAYLYFQDRIWGRLRIKVMNQ